MKNTKPQTGFTLIELLIVISLLVVLASITMYFLNPLARFQDSRNARRWSDLEAMSHAVGLYEVDHGGRLMDSLSLMAYDVYYQIGTQSSGCDTVCAVPSVSLQPGCLDLSNLVIDGYLSSIPSDPNYEGASSLKTGYYIMRPSGVATKFIFGSCAEEQGSGEEALPIEITK